MKRILITVTILVGWIGVVQWNRGSFWVYEVAGESSGEESQWSIDLDYEVIGNIYENPNLIDG